MQRDLGEYRKSYDKSGLDNSDLQPDPMVMFQKWFHELEASKSLEEPNAMTLATHGLDGFPRSRVVLLKQVSADGFTFFTNYKSEKGRAIGKDPRVCLSFYWPGLERQVIIQGTAEKLPEALSDGYFDSRPEGSKLGAIVSDQSQVIFSRKELEDKLRELEKAYKGQAIKRPSHWGGYLVKPSTIEFWQGRPNRLHDRIRYRPGENKEWIIERLAP